MPQLEKYVIQGGIPLKGAVSISGAKNAALPLLAAALLTKDTVTLHNVPVLADTSTMFTLLEILGKKIIRNGTTVVIEEHQNLNVEAPYDIVSKMRASIAVMGPLTARMGRAKISFPGGCAIGPRPIDLHIKGIEELSASCSIEHGYLIVETSGNLVGKTMDLSGKNGSSVLATENIMMAATLAKGKTTINSAAKEPEVSDLANMLISMGAKISGIGTSSLVIEGTETLHGTEYTVVADRIEAGTFILAAGITQGDIIIENCVPEHLEEPIRLFREAGMTIEILSSTSLRACGGKIKGVNVATLPYPGFPTDLQAQFLAMLSIADGNSSIEENIYPDRYMHAAELNRMGADIHIDQAHATIRGVSRLSGAAIMSSDLRGGAALVLAGLASEGETQVLRIYHIDRGYEMFEQKLSSLGAQIRRTR